jgi:predicted nucleic acid-binding protein
MLVVSDASPFIALIKIGLVEILPKLYGSVIIPPEVAKELTAATGPVETRSFMAKSPAWLKVQAPKVVEHIKNLDPGERAAISLARELRADLLLIDETRGRREAIARNIPTIRTAAVLFDAATANHINDLADAYDRLERTDFRVPREALDELLRQHQAKRQQSQS